MTLSLFFVFFLIVPRPTSTYVWAANLEEDGRPVVISGLRGLKQKGSDVVVDDNTEDGAQKKNEAKQHSEEKIHGDEEERNHAKQEAKSKDEKDEKGEEKADEGEMDEGEKEKKRHAKQEVEETKDDKTHAEQEAKDKKVERERGRAEEEGNKDNEIVKHIVKNDIVQKLIRPSRLMPFYMLPIAGSIKILVQFLVIGSDLKMKPIDPRESSLETLRKWFKHICGMVPFILLALNSWKLDWKDLQEVSELIPKEQNSFVVRTIIRMVILITSSNFVAAIGLWAGILAQSPRTALDLNPKYAAIPLLRGFPWNPFGTEWLLPLKWLYAMILVPYAIWALPGYFVLSWIQCSVNCPLCWCNGITGFFVYVWNLIKLDCLCCWGGCKCAFWSILTIITLGFWAKAKSEFLAFWPVVWTVGYFLLLSVWIVVVPLLCTTIYGCMICTKSENITYALVPQNAVATPEEAPGQQSMSSDTQMQQQFDSVISPCTSCFPQHVPTTYISPELKRTMCIFNAAVLNKDFEVPQSLLDQQQEYFENKHSHHETDSVKLATMKAMMQAGAQVVLTQITFLVLLRTSFWMQAAYYSTDPGTAITGSLDFAGRAYFVTLSERHWYSYMHFMERLARHGVRNMSKLSEVLDIFWNLF